ncbi:transposase [Polaribacter sp.]|uniref:transposase n=1 Tax=Polaribacter sp. TaxID=1920175 RepID=UPI003EFAEA36
MRALETIKLDHFYHIYNRGINGEDLFYSDENYRYFLKLYKKYIFPVAETFAWCLLKNHFHFLVKIRTEVEICTNFSIDTEKAVKKPSQQFSHFFNAYVQAINNQNKRHGSLLEKLFRRIELKDETYLKNLILYIHNNPIQHGFDKKLTDYPWSSYFSIISDKKSAIEKDKVIYQFETKENFIDSHQLKIDSIATEKWLNI